MAYVVETNAHPYLNDVIIEVLEKTAGEYVPESKICSLGIEFINRYSPDDLINMGNWLIENGKRIKKEYTSTGKRKKKFIV
jgi:hypothetical protein